MTVSELIDVLQKCHPDAAVLAWDADSERMEEVSGIVYDDTDAPVELQTDDIT